MPKINMSKFIYWTPGIKKRWKTKASLKEAMIYEFRIFRRPRDNKEAKFEYLDYDTKTWKVWDPMS